MLGTYAHPLVTARLDAELTLQGETSGHHVSSCLHATFQLELRIEKTIGQPRNFLNNPGPTWTRSNLCSWRGFAALYPALAAPIPPWRAHPPRSRASESYPPA